MKKLISTILIITIIISVFSVATIKVFAIGNYGVNLDSACYSASNPFKGYRGQCTWYAWGRAFEKTGTQLGYRGNAKTWTSGAVSTPRANSVVVWTGGKYGHVAFVEAYDGTNIYISEANRVSLQYSEGYINLSTGRFTFTYGGTGSYNVDLPYGYIHLGGNPDPTPVDIGTNFYAFIINVNAWKHLTVDSNVNVTIRSEKAGKSPDQVFRFERQADRSYKIISTANGWCLDVNGASSASGANVSVCGSNDSDAQRWYIYGSSGEYRLKAKCTDCWLDTYGASTNDGTNIHMYSTSFDNAQKFQIWSLEDRPEAADIGDGFTAPILNTKSWITFENNDGNLILNKEVGKSNQLWKFQRNLDGSYTIFSCPDGMCIDLYNFLHADDTNIGMCAPNNTNAQRWYFL